MFEKVLEFIICVLWINLMDKIYSILLSKLYAKKCNYDCSKCKMWSCVNETENENENYYVGIYDNFSNVCGKDKRNV